MSKYLSTLGYCDLIIELTILNLVIIQSRTKLPNDHTNLDTLHTTENQKYHHIMTIPYFFHYNMEFFPSQYNPISSAAVVIGALRVEIEPFGFSLQKYF